MQNTQEKQTQPISPMDNINSTNYISNKAKDYILMNEQVSILREILMNQIQFENILEMVNPKLKDMYIERFGEIVKDQKLSDILNTLLLSFSTLNNEEKMLMCFLCPKNIDADIPEILSYSFILKEKLEIVNKSNKDYILGHSKQILQFIMKQSVEHYYASKLKVYLTDEDEEEDLSNRVELTEEETREQMEEVMQHPLFMTEIPENIEGNKYLEAIQAIKYDENPEEIAKSNLKKSSELLFDYKNKKKFRDLKESMVLITNAIDHCMEDETVSLSIKLKILIHRAEINHFIKNYKHSLDDIKSGLKLTSQLKNLSDFEEIEQELFKMLDIYLNSAVKLKSYKEIDNLKNMIKSVLTAFKNSDNKYLLTKLEEFISNVNNEVKFLKNQQTKQMEEIETIKKLEVDEQFKLYEKLQNRGITLMKQIHGLPVHCEAKITEDEEGQFVFPVLIVYEEFNMTDFMQKCHETTTIGEIIDMLFEQDLPWDKEKKYSKLSVLAYYEFKKDFTKDSISQYIPCKKQDQLIDILTHKRAVMNGFPVLSIVSFNSKFYPHFLKTKAIIKRKVNKK